MSSWYSNILTNTSSRLNNLQRQVFASEADGDTEDDTHVCRVLRSYYSETGRGLPAWLPPDPKGPPPIVQQQGNPQAGVGSRYGAAGAAPPNNRWDSSSSLRAGAGAGGRGGQGAAAAAAQGGSRNPFARSNAVTTDPSSAAGAGAGGLAAQQARPLTGQRTGSSQTAGSEVSVGGGGGGGGGGVSSAQDRLRQRLWGSGARTTSPNSGTGPFAPPPQQQQQQPQHSGGGSGYARGGSVSSASAGGGGGGDYDPYGPGGQYDGRHGGVPPRRGLPGNPRMR